MLAANRKAERVVVARIDEQMTAVNRDLQALFVRLMLIAGALLFPFMFVRDLAVAPWWIAAHLSTLSIILAAYMLQERLPAWVLTASVSVFLYLLSTSELWIAGVTTPALFGYALLLIIVPAVLSIRIGAIAALICAATYVLIGLLREPEFHDLHGGGSVSFDAWLYAGAFFWGCASIVFVLMSRMNVHIRHLIRSEVDRAEALLRANADLVESNDRYTALNEQLEARVKARTAELEAANRGLVDANVRLEAFNYMVSHDLRSPLQTIDGFSRMLVRDLGGNLTPVVERDLGRIQSGVERLQGMVIELLKLAQRGDTELQLQSVDMSAMATEIVEELRLADPERNVDVEVESGVQASADPVLIREVLQNLLGNAWKFTAKQTSPQIDFGVLEVVGTPIYFVHDNGAGFDPARMHELFQPFHRLHSASEFSGTGVGLAAAQRIVECHGGEIWAESAPGKGAKFYFTLPDSLGAAANEHKANGTNAG